MDRRTNIVQVCTADGGGGAEEIARQLHLTFRRLGCDAWLLVGHKRTDDSCTLAIPNERYRNVWARLWQGMGDLVSAFTDRVRGVGRLRYVLSYCIGQPSRWIEIQRGREDFDFPATWRLLDLPPAKPNILHLHNLHGGYFDLRALPLLTRQVPVVLTMHDAWLLSGHCAHSFDCERWKSGCGQCPDLSIYPAIRRDSTAYNWRRKKGLYAQSRLYVAAPSQWLLQTVGQSMLAPAVIESRVIPNGVDTDVFHPDDKAAARTELGISPGARVLVFAAAGIRRNAFKDYRTMRAAVALVAERLHESNVLFVGLGEDAPAEQVGAARVVFVEYQKDREALARYYQAADVYIHAARAESWGLTITEALACGIPVAATATGGIPEQVKGLRWDGMTSGSAMCDPSEATGVLASPGDSPGLAAGIELLLTDDDLRRRLGSNAARDAHQRFSLDRQASDYLAWYKEILAEKETEKECPVRA